MPSPGDSGNMVSAIMKLVGVKECDAFHKMVLWA